MQPYGGGTFHNWESLSPYGGSGGAEFVAQMMAFVAMVAFVGIALTAFQVWLFYRIFTKAGYNGWWSLLSLIPGVGLLVVLLVLAFDRWPAQMDGGVQPIPEVTVASAPNPFTPYDTPVSQPVVPPVAPEPPLPPVSQVEVPLEPPVPPAVSSEESAESKAEDPS